MSPDQIIKAWKDEEFRRGLSQAEQALLPQNPAGSSELSDEELLGVTGGMEEEAIGPTIITTTLASVAFSCGPACDQSAWKGTCALFTIGCCRQVVETQIEY